MLDDLTLTEMDHLFTITRQQTIPYEKSDAVQFSVTFERDLTLETIERQMYTIFDMLSDLGGLSEMLMFISLAILAGWNFLSFESYLVSLLYKHNVNPPGKKRN